MNRSSLLSAGPFLVNTGISAFTQYNAMRAEKSLGKFLQGQIDLQAKAQNLQAREQATELRKRALSDISQARALFAARGIDSSSGTALKAYESSYNNAQEDVNQLLGNAVVQQMQFGYDRNITGARSNLSGINRLAKIGKKLNKSLLDIFPYTDTNKLPTA